MHGMEKGEISGWAVQGLSLSHSTQMDGTSLPIMLPLPFHPAPLPWEITHLYRCCWNQLPCPLHISHHVEQWQMIAILFALLFSLYFLPSVATKQIKRSHNIYHAVSMADGTTARREPRFIFNFCLCVTLLSLQL